MGQYHVICNITKREKIHPYKLGLGLKQCEQAGYGTPGLLFYLLCFKYSRGGGDFDDAPNKGRWFGDQIAVIGDYAKKDDDPRFDATEGYNAYEDITEEVMPEWEMACEVRFLGQGWMRAFEYADLRAAGLTEDVPNALSEQDLAKVELVRLKRRIAELKCWEQNLKKRAPARKESVK